MGPNFLIISNQDITGYQFSQYSVILNLQGGKLSFKDIQETAQAAHLIAQ